MDKSTAPPYTLTDVMVNLVAEITALATKATIRQPVQANPKLRRDNQIKTIHASLAIENNTLSVDQVTDIFRGKRILGPPDEIQEVKNAFDAYKRLMDFDPYSVSDLLLAHGILMKDLTKEAGIFRRGGVGIFTGERLAHMAPPAGLVAELMENLLAWTRETDAHPLIKSCVFHYECEFIHPFADGNGRMGRMWQTLLLHQWEPIFGWLPMEILIKERQAEYYRVLGACDKAGDSGSFIAFNLLAIRDTLIEMEENARITEQVTDYVTVQVPQSVRRMLAGFTKDEMSAMELMEAVGLKHRATFRENYLLPALESGLIEMTVPDKPRSSKQKYRKVRDLRAGI